MAKELACGQCQTSLMVPWNMLGKWVRCPNCRETFLAEESSFLPPLEPAAVRPGRPAAAVLPQDKRGVDIPNPADSTYLRIVKESLDQRDRQRSWANVRSGLRIMYAGLGLGAGSFLALVLLNLVEILALDLLGPQLFDRPWIPSPFNYIEIALLCGIVPGTILYVAGAVVCLRTRAPRTRHCLAGHLLFVLFFFVTAVNLWRNNDGWKLDAAVTRSLQVMALASLAGIVCLRLYLKRLCVFLDGSREHRAASYYSFQLCWFMATAMLVHAAVQRANDFRRALIINQHPPIAELVGWLLLLTLIGVGGAVVTLIWTEKLLRKTWELIRPEQRGDEA